MLVRRQKIADALYWLIKNNELYKDVCVNQQSLNTLPENDVPDNFISVETENNKSDSSYPDYSPQSEEDIVYNKPPEMSSFLPLAQCQQQEIEAVQHQLLLNHLTQRMPCSTVDSEPLNEYITPFLATMAFPSLLPDGQGDPTNPSIRLDIPLGEK